MNDNELINRFLDGETTPVQEEFIKVRLKNDASFREEFVDMQDLQNTALRDANSIEVPEDLTQQLMQGLDFAGSSSSARRGVLLPFLFKYRVPATMLGVLLIAGAFFGFGFGTGENASSTSSAPVTSSRLLAPSNANAVPQVSSILASAETVSGRSGNSGSVAFAREDNNSLISANSSEDFVREEEDVSESATVTTATATATASELPAAINLSNAFLGSNSYTSSYIPTTGRRNLTSDYSVSDIRFPLSKFEVSVGTVAGDYGRHLTTLDGETSGGLFLNNCNISALYKLNGEHAFGVEISNEKFYQEFSYRAYGQEYRYAQEPSYTTYSAQYRYMPNALNIIEELHPYAKVAVGGNRGGAVSKAQAGIKLTVTPTISVNFAAEESLMLFNTVKDNYFVSDKFRLLCEISLNL